MNELETLLSAVRSHYGQLLQLLEQLAPGLEHDAAAAVQHLLPRWDRELRAAQSADRALEPLLPTAPSSCVASIQDYRRLQAELLQASRTLAERAQTLKALTAAELAGLRGGKVAMAGYRPLGAAAGRAFTTRG